MSKDNRVNSLSFFLAALWLTGVLVTKFTGDWVVWVVVLAATVMNIRVAAAMGRTRRKR